MSNIGPISPSPYPPNLFVGPVDPRVAGNPAFDMHVAANTACGNSFRVSAPVTVTKVTYSTGGVAAGNIDIGICKSGTAAAFLTTTGSTAVGSAYATHDVNLLASVTLLPGILYWAVWSGDNGSARFMGPLAYGGTVNLGASNGLASANVNMFPLAGNTFNTETGGGSALIFLWFR